MHAEVKNWVRSGDRKAVFSNRGYRARGDREAIDLSDLRLLHAGVDTFKQLFRGFLNPGSYELVSAHHDSGLQYPIVFGDYAFKVTRAGAKSGFQWILRNLDIGVVVMLKSFYAEADAEGTHLKIEYSPHLIERSDPTDIDNHSLAIASMFLTEFRFSDIAAHIAVDLKGWVIPDNFESHLITKARRHYGFSGINELNFDINAVAVKYGEKESFTFGRSGSLQFCVYDNTKEMQQRDKAAFWQSIWRRTPGVEDPFEPEYQDGDTVTRLELRFHHSVIQQFCKGTNGMAATNFSQLVLHLTGLFQYGLDNFRLHHSRNYIDPVWQWMLEDVPVYGPARPLIYRRDYKSESASSRRNVAFWLGNAMRLFARQSFTVDHVVNYFMHSGLLQELKAYCGIPPSASDSELFMVLHECVRRRMEEHQLNGVHH